MSQVIDNSTTDVQPEPINDFGMGDFFEENSPAPAKEEMAAISSEQVVEKPVEVAPAEVSVDAPKNVETTAVPQGGLPGGSSAPVSTTQTEAQPLSAEQELEGMRMQFNEAMGQMSVMMGQMAAQQSKETVKLELPKNPQEISTLDFLDGQSPTDFLESPEAFNALMNRVATIAARAGQQAGYEMAMRSVPSVVQSSAQQQFQLQTAADNFYKTNADLVPFKKAVSLAALDFYSKNPGSTPEQILDGAAVATRNILRMRGTTAGRVPAQPAATPGAVGGGSRTATPSQLTPLEQQILDTISAAQ